jgi:hypothetical protein
VKIIINEAIHQMGKIRAADAKEVGVGNPAEETYCYPNNHNVTVKKQNVNKNLRHFIDYFQIIFLRKVEKTSFAPKFSLGIGGRGDARIRGKSEAGRAGGNDCPVDFEFTLSKERYGCNMAPA